MEIQVIQSKIYELRGCKVMLDFDLAAMYRVETRALNQAVKRNINRFPEDFMFQLTKIEWQTMLSQFVMTRNNENLISQNVTSSWGGTRKLPYAFTEQGVAMLSGLLNSDVAVAANISIMRAFVFVRKMLLNPPIGEFTQLQQDVRRLKEYIEEVFSDYNDINEDTRIQLELINQSLAALQAQKRIEGQPRKRIGFRQAFDEHEK
ncbi:MAG: ORF6N domain-containing protein [Prevotellaceae bacterium]|jgi:hypothetical protein|nr:ORF6N domain-containing protein [Prevotellaceae bacterium]